MSPGQVSLFISLFHLFSSLVPRPLHRFFASLGNHLVFFILRGSRESVKQNLRVIGRSRYSEEEVSRLAKQCFQNYCHKLLDYMTLDRLSSSNLKKWIEKETGEENLVRALTRGKGVLCITPHLGNWELGGYVLASKGYPINILTLREESPYLSRYEENLRRKAGIHTISIDLKERPNMAILEIAKRLRGNEIVAMVADRVYEGQGVEIDFFGRQTLFPTGAVQVALETGATLIPVFVILERKMKYWGVIGEPIPIKMDTDRKEAVRQSVQEIAKRFEEVIHRYPDQWFNFFPFWKDNVPGKVQKQRGLLSHRREDL